MAFTNDNIHKPLKLLKIMTPNLELDNERLQNI